VVQRGFLGPLRMANTHDNFKRKDIFMRRGLSRRNLVTGTAWAAPLVLSTAVIPAYASSSADDGPCLDPDKSYGIFAKDVRTAAQSRAAGEKGYEEIVVPDYASYMRFYLRGGVGGAGAGGSWCGRLRLVRDHRLPRPGARHPVRRSVAMGGIRQLPD